MPWEWLKNQKGSVDGGRKHFIKIRYLAGRQTSSRQDGKTVQATGLTSKGVPSCLRDFYGVIKPTRSGQGIAD